MVWTVVGLWCGLWLDCGVDCGEDCGVDCGVDCVGHVVTYTRSTKPEELMGLATQCGQLKTPSLFFSGHVLDVQNSSVALPHWYCIQNQLGNCFVL